MSIPSEITRISGNVADALAAIADKGVTVPSGSSSDDLADLIAAIPSGGGGISVVETPDPGGGTVLTITGEEVKLQSKTATPTESAQTITPDNGYSGLSSVSVGAIASSYVGSGVARKSSTDLTASGATVTVPSGYYASQASKSVTSGTAGTPTATKGTVSNHSVTVTPSVTNTTGYITGSTKTGTAVTVTAAELESGTKSITANGTGIDVTGYAAVDVAVPTGGASKNFQIDNTNHRINTTSYTNTGAYLKVTKAGKYDIYWSAFRSSTSTGTNGTQWYKNGVAQGSAYTTWSNGYCQNPHVSGVTLAVNDEIEIYARASSNSRYCCVENLTIIEVD